MISLDQLYAIRQKIPKFIRRLFPKFHLFQYYFLPTNLKRLPELNYPEKGDIEHQRDLIKKFQISKKQTSSMTCPHLIELIHMKFNSNDSFYFLDIGGEKIDFYLNLKNNFKNVKYFLFNQKSMLNPFHEIKDELNLEDLILVDKIEDISDNNYDFVNFGSCIQYFNDYESFLKKIANISKYIFFSGTHLYDNFSNDLSKNLVVKQVNVLPQTNYLYFFNRESFFKILLEENFKIVFEENNLTDKINYNNFAHSLKNLQYSDFLFEKK